MCSPASELWVACCKFCSINSITLLSWKVVQLQPYWLLWPCSFTMVFTQNSSILHWAVHQPIALFQVWSLLRPTEGLWLPLQRHIFLHVYACTQITSTEMSCFHKIAELEIQFMCGECLKRTLFGQWFFRQYCIGRPLRTGLLLCDRWQTLAQTCCYM